MIIVAPVREGQKPRQSGQGKRILHPDFAACAASLEMHGTVWEGACGLQAHDDGVWIETASDADRVSIAKKRLRIISPQWRTMKTQCQGGPRFKMSGM